MEATLAERGQVVIPKAIRDQLGLTPGALLTFSVEDGKLVIRKKVDDAISRVRGRFKLAAGDSLEQWMRDTRGRAPNDPIEPWEELRDDIEIPAAIREDHARRRKKWLAENANEIAKNQSAFEASLFTPEKMAAGVKIFEMAKQNARAKPNAAKKTPKVAKATKK
jgi:antitoxin PrlF